MDVACDGPSSFQERYDWRKPEGNTSVELPEQIHPLVICERLHALPSGKGVDYGSSLQIYAGDGTLAVIAYQRGLAIGSEGKSHEGSASGFHHLLRRVQIRRTEDVNLAVGKTREQPFPVWGVEDFIQTLFDSFDLDFVYFRIRCGGNHV